MNIYFIIKQWNALNMTISYLILFSLVLLKQMIFNKWKYTVLNISYIQENTRHDMIYNMYIYITQGGRNQCSSLFTNLLSLLDFPKTKTMLLQKNLIYQRPNPTKDVILQKNLQKSTLTSHSKFVWLGLLKVGFCSIRSFVS